MRQDLVVKYTIRKNGLMNTQKQNNSRTGCIQQFAYSYIKSLLIQKEFVHMMLSNFYVGKGKHIITGLEQSYIHYIFHLLLLTYNLHTIIFLHDDNSYFCVCLGQLKE